MLQRLKENPEVANALFILILCQNHATNIYCFMSLKGFVFSTHFLRQLAIAAALAVIIIWTVLKLLDLYTLHGRNISVPDIVDLQVEDASELLYAENLRYVINDSVFDETRETGSIARQDPMPGSKVKKNRTIYLTTVAVLPEMVAMPNLIDLSRRQALSVLETHGLKVGRLDFQPDIARNAVIEQLYRDGPIEPGTPVKKGTVIDLILGEGLGENITLVPLVIGMERSEAIRALNNASLNIGRETYMDDLEENIKVYMQNPDPLDTPKYLEAGREVALFYRSADLFDFDEYLEQLLSVPLPDLVGLTAEEAYEKLEQASLEIGLETYEEGATMENARIHRQSPPFQPGQIIKKGSTINVWYRPYKENEEDNQEAVNEDR